MTASQDDAMTAEAKVVDDIISDMTSRRGLRHAWDDIDEDVQAEIRETWIAIVANALASAHSRENDMAETRTDRST